MSSGKIAVIGANQGALAFAILASREGFDVSLYEKEQQDEVAYDWTDDMMADTFTKIGLETMPDRIRLKDRITILIPPGKSGGIELPAPDEPLDMPVLRRKMNMWLYKQAIDAGAKIYYGVGVKAAICDKTKVTGIILDSGEKVLTDMTVDCGGAASAVRSSLPDCLHIPQKVSPSETFYVRRIFFERPEGTERPKMTNRIYLKHLEEAGISWCTLSVDETAADVLVGRLYGLTDEVFERALADLKKENEIIGDRAVKGGQLLRIPVRHPISRMICDGYALLGDSAYMTIPMIGSGMENCLLASRMLCDVISKPDGERFSASNLYRYQYRYMKSLGAGHACMDLLKNWFIKSRKGELDFLFGSSVIRDILFQSTGGASVNLKVSEVFTVIRECISKPGLLVRLGGLVLSMNKQEKTTAEMPEKYDDEALLRWQKKYEAIYE